MDCYDSVEMTHDQRCLDDDKYTDVQNKLMPFIKWNPVVVLSFLAKQAVLDYLYKFDDKMDFYTNAKMALQARAKHLFLGQSSNHGFKDQDIRIPEKKTEDYMNTKCSRFPFLIRGPKQQHQTWIWRHQKKTRATTITLLCQN